LSDWVGALWCRSRVDGNRRIRSWLGPDASEGIYGAGALAVQTAAVGAAQQRVALRCPFAQ
jgi:hypothetical protein